MANNISAGRIESDGATTAVDMVVEAGTIVYVVANEFIHTIADGGAHS